MPYPISSALLAPVHTHGFLRHLLLSQGPSLARSCKLPGSVCSPGQPSTNDGQDLGVNTQFFIALPTPQCQADPRRAPKSPVGPSPRSPVGDPLIKDLVDSCKGPHPHPWKTSVSPPASASYCSFLHYPKVSLPGAPGWLSRLNVRLQLRS